VKIIRNLVFVELSNYNRWVT